jgi:hypothetical protein
MTYVAETVHFVGHMATDHPNEFITAIATSVVALFTIVLAFSTTLLWRAARIQASDFKQSVAAAITGNEIAATNAEQQLRAYVTAKEINLVTHRSPATPGAYVQIEGPILTYGLSAILRNGGQTPATNVVINVTCQKFAKELPADFEFPDSPVFGFGLIGPDSEMHTPLIRISAAELQSIDADTEWYFWGWVEYDDIFSGTIRHRTEFCFRFERSRLPVTGEFWIGFNPYPRFNAADADCLRPIDSRTSRRPRA